MSYVDLTTLSLAREPEEREAVLFNHRIFEFMNRGEVDFPPKLNQEP